MYYIKKVALNSANETTGKDIYLDSGALNTSDSITIANGNITPIGTHNNANTLTEEITHSNGQGEASASTMGDLGEIAYNVGKWANSGDIADAKDKVNVTVINSANTAKEQQEMLAANKERLETQQEAGDAFENQPYFQCDPVFGCMPPHQLKWARENPQEWAKRNKQFNKFLEYVYEDIFLYTLDGASAGKASSASVAVGGSIKVISKGGRKVYQVIRSGEVFTFDYNTVNKLIAKGQRNLSEAILSVRKSTLIAPPRTAAQIRNGPGKSFSSNTLTELKVGQSLFNGRNSAKVPKQVADRLSGRSFNNFDQFRKAFWKEMANDPAVSRNFSSSNLASMRAGNAPYVIGSQQRGGRKVYELDHHIEIRDGGAVYNLDNIVIRTPVNHINKTSNR